MFYSRLDAQQAAQTAQTAAQQAAQTAAQAAQVAAQTAAQAAQDTAQTARGWAAPQLENAADYYATTVSPRITDALRSTARQVSPDRSGSRLLGRRLPGGRALQVSLLVAAGIAAAGAAAVLVRHKYKAAMAADTEFDVVDVEDSDEPGPVSSAAAQADAVAGV